MVVKCLKHYITQSVFFITISQYSILTSDSSRKQPRRPFRQRRKWKWAGLPLTPPTRALINTVIPRFLGFCASAFADPAGSFLRNPHRGRRRSRRKRRSARTWHGPAGAFDVTSKTTSSAICQKVINWSGHRRSLSHRPSNIGDEDGMAPSRWDRIYAMSFHRQIVCYHMIYRVRLGNSQTAIVTQT